MSDELAGVVFLALPFAVLSIVALAAVWLIRRHPIDKGSSLSPKEMAWRMSPFAGILVGLGTFWAIQGDGAMSALCAVGVVLFGIGWSSYRRTVTR